MFALHSRRLRRRLSAPTSGSLRRRARERKQAEQTRAEGERLARARRELAQREKLQSQRQARLELATYEPWGRAGGGAPNAGGNRFTKIRAKGIYPEDELRGVQLVEACYRWPSSPLRRNRRTPLRLREDPQLCYAENLRQSVENDIRYRQTPGQQRDYKEILDDLVQKRQKALHEEMRRNLEYEQKMHSMEGPWGKPGPGGTTWRNPRDIGLNFAKSMGWTDNEIFRKMTGDPRCHQRSSVTLPKVNREGDSCEENLNNKENVQPSSTYKLPDITHNNSANAKGRKKRNERRESEPVHSKAKGKRSPRKSKLVKRLPNGEEVTRLVPLVVPDDYYPNNIPREEEPTNGGEKKLTPEAKILRMTGGIELVPLLARRRRVGARTLPSSDVTRPPEDHCQWREMLDQEYLTVLKHQIKVKCQQKEDSRRDSAESARLHHDTWASLWGRPGHGAPQQGGRYGRSNLARLLYVNPLTSGQYY